MQNVPVRALYHSRRPDISFGDMINWQQCDLLDVWQLEDALQGISHIYHCAAMISFDPRKKKQIIQHNVTLTANVVNAALDAGISKMVHVSSVAALGRPVSQKDSGPVLIGENFPWMPGKNNSAYAESKYLSELEVWRGIAEGLPAVIVNPATILGAGDWEKGSAHLMKIVDEEFPWFTQGVNGWVNVKDVASAMILLMDSAISAERFILSCGNYAYKDVFTQMAQMLHRRPPHRKAGKWMTEIVWRLKLLQSRMAGKEAVISRETARTAQTQHLYNNEKFLRWFPQFHYYTLGETIEQMAELYLQQNKHG